MIITLPGPPIAKKRHRSTIRNGRIATYGQQSDDEMTVKWIIKNAIRNQPNSIDINAPCEVTIDFQMPIPKSASKKKQKDLLTTPHTTKPDLDNLAKFYLDASNEILWHDDRQITSLYLSKCYSEKPQTIIKIKITPGAS